MSIDLIRATLPKRCTYGHQVHELAKLYLPDGSAEQIDTLAMSIQWTIESELDSMKFEEESANG
jgi:hypothetical protein